jgi:SAM-dependent methyltransferase
MELRFLEQDCSLRWELDSEILSVVFTSNFLEHLPVKSALQKTLVEAHRALKPGGRFIAMGPNIKYAPGAYWDFFDHHLPLTELSLGEVLEKCGFEVEFSRAPSAVYDVEGERSTPRGCSGPISRFRSFGPSSGRQFLVAARKALLEGGSHYEFVPARIGRCYLSTDE